MLHSLLQFSTFQNDKVVSLRGITNSLLGKILMQIFIQKSSYLTFHHTVMEQNYLKFLLSLEKVLVL